MKNCLITGARGFIGRHLAKHLFDQGNRVVGLGHGAWSEIDSAKWGVTSWFNGDVTRQNIDIILKSQGDIDFVYHLAGGSSVGPSLITPMEDFQRSVNSTLEILEWARLSHKKPMLILASSAAVYGNEHFVPISTKNVPNPGSPYGVHKAIAEQLFLSYGKSFGVNVSIVRLFSVFGPELHKQLLWDCCNKLQNNSTELILGGTGKEVRDWIYSKNAVNIIEQVSYISSPECPIFNAGTGIGTSIEVVANEICQAWGKNINVRFTGISRIGDPVYLVADMSSKINFEKNPYIDFKLGLSEYVSWYKQSHS